MYIEMNLDFTVLYSGINEYFQNNPYIAIALAGILLLMLFRKPKLFFTLLFVSAVIAGSLFLITNISNLGLEKKNIIVHEGSKDSDLQR